MFYSRQYNKPYIRKGATEGSNLSSCGLLRVLAMYEAKYINTQPIENLSDLFFIKRPIVC